MTLPTELLVAAQTRIAAEHGIPIVVRHRGDPSSGTVVLKINLLDGTARVLTQIRLDDELAWSPVLGKDHMKEEEAERYLLQQTNIDPDVWIVEIEDRKGRHWFPGRVMKI